MCCMMAIFVSGFDTMISKANDVKRRSDAREIEKALDVYHDKYGVYPDSIDDWRKWDLSFEYKNKKGFLKILSEEKILQSETVDPINNESHYYRYAKYKTGTYGCAGSFYVLQVSNFEVASDKNGNGECPELDFVEEMPNGYTIQRFD